jgi:hypothetical protein
MFRTQKYVFIEALVITIIIFALGVMAGFLLENWRTSKVDVLYQNSEVNLLDVKVQTEIYSNWNFDCKSAVKENIDFANRIYDEAKQLEKYQKASILTESLIVSHEKYDLLRAMLLLNSVKIKEKCNASYHDVVYLYKYRDKNPNIIAKESVFSNLLVDLKAKKGDEVLLIPMAADNELASVKLILSTYNVSTDELPVVVIDGKIKINKVENINDLLIYFD